MSAALRDFNTSDGLKSVTVGSNNTSGPGRPERVLYISLDDGSYTEPSLALDLDVAKDLHNHIGAVIRDIEKRIAEERFAALESAPLFSTVVPPKPEGLEDDWYPYIKMYNGWFLIDGGTPLATDLFTLKEHIDNNGFTLVRNEGTNK